MKRALIGVTDHGFSFRLMSLTKQLRERLGYRLGTLQTEGCDCLQNSKIQCKEKIVKRPNLKQRIFNKSGYIYFKEGGKHICKQTNN